MPTPDPDECIGERSSRRWDDVGQADAIECAAKIAVLIG